MSDAARTPDEVEDLLNAHPNARVFDVRTARDRAERPIIGGSEHLPVNEALAAGQMEALLDQGLPDDAPLVFVCNSGGKCGRAAAYLREQGFDAVSVEGGMRAWQAAGKPVDESAK